MAIDERELDDSALVEAAQQGDHDAFAELFRRHYPTVRRVCARRLGNATEADEVAQAAFVRAYERLHQCEGERRFGAWVQVIAYNLGADARRHHARAVLTDDPMVGDAALGPNHCEDHVLQAERVAEVRTILDTLPPRQREVIVARDMEGRRPGEIAASLGLSLGAVDSLLLRARRRMAVVWKTAGPEQGAATFPTAASIVATTAAVTPGPISRAIAAASYRIAAAVGVVPGGSLPARVGSAIGGAVVVGTLATVPSATHAPPDAVVKVPSVVNLQHVSVPAMRLTIPDVPTPVLHLPALPVAVQPLPTLPALPAPVGRLVPHVQPTVPSIGPSVNPVGDVLARVVDLLNGVLHTAGLTR